MTSAFVSFSFICLSSNSGLKSVFGILKSILQSGERKGKRPRVSSPYRAASTEETLPPNWVGGPSQPQPLPEHGQDLSSDSSDEERSWVSFAAIMNAAVDGPTGFEGDHRYLNRWPGPFFSDDSSDTEYSSATKLSNASSSPQFEEDWECTKSSSRVCTLEIIVFTKDANEDEVVDILD